MWLRRPRDIDSGPWSYQWNRKLPASSFSWRRMSRKQWPNALVWTSGDGCVLGLMVAGETWVKEGLGTTFLWRWRCGISCFHFWGFGVNREIEIFQPFSKKLFNMQFNGSIFKKILLSKKKKRTTSSKETISNLKEQHVSFHQTSLQMNEVK